MRRGQAVAATVLVALAMTITGTGTGILSPAAAVSTDQSYWVPVGKKIEVTGHGYGHGHGMSQYGAQGAATQGLGYRQIAEFYYPGTSWGRVRGKVRVLITADTSDDVVVSPAAGLTVRDLADGSVHELPIADSISRWRLDIRGGKTVLERLTPQGWQVEELEGGLAGDAEFSAQAPITLWTPSGAKTYRGILRSASPSSGAAGRDTVNIVTIDQYVMGVVPYEMPASWHPEAVKAQAVAARTYATWSRSQNPRRHYQICDTTSCQVYGGMSGEDPRSNAAVRATSREILTHGGRPAFTQFSASSGGWTSAGSVPYLPAQEDPYDGWAGNSVHTWSVAVDASVLERSYPDIGSLERIRVTSRDGNGEWQGRVTSMVLEGSHGNRSISGDSFRWAFGLRSNWFTIEPTPIMSRWSRLGGTSSPLGDARSAEYAVASGAAQRFASGRIFYSPRTGARELYGAVLRKYQRIGGPESSLGFPTSGVLERGMRRLAHFQRGSIFRLPSTPPRVVLGAIDRRYRAGDGTRAALGWPTSSTYEVPGGLRSDFMRGHITWHAESRTAEVVVNR